ncbi:MAG: ketose-bisphosphate aldolase [Clostridia bacterium]
MENRPITLGKMLTAAQEKYYAVGAFNCRYFPMIESVLRAAQNNKSPVCIEISQKEIELYQIDLYEFVNEVRRTIEREHIIIPYCIHLDHATDFDLIKEAREAGFTSVMIDASQYELAENISRTREVVQYAHVQGISVEAELGTIGSADGLETDNDKMIYTVPEEAAAFVKETNIDALAISIGSAHGIFSGKKPKLDIDRLIRVREFTKIPLVLHGGTGISKKCIRQAITIEGGGISKLNIATELEKAFLAAVGKDKRLSANEIKALDIETVKKARGAVERVVQEKINDFLGSANRA